MTANIDLIDGSDAALQNAKRLILCANLLATNGEYGPANSLLVLAIEESVKAGFLSACAIAGEPLTSDPNLIKTLKRHKYKHYFGFVTRLMLDSTAQLMNDPRVLSGIEERFKDLRESDTEEFLKRFEELIREVISQTMTTMQTALLQDASIGDRHWWREADALRNRGFYTDWENGTWSAPARIERTDYEKTRTTAQKLLSEVEGYRVKSPQGVLFLRRVIFAVHTRQADMVAALPDDL